MSQKDIFKKKKSPTFPPGLIFFIFFLRVLLPAFKVSLFPAEWCWYGCWPTFFIVSPWPDSYLWIKLEFSQLGMDAERVLVGFRSTYHLSSVIYPQRFHHIHLKSTSDWTWCYRSSVLCSALLQEIFPIQVPNSLPSFFGGWVFYFCLFFIAISLYILCSMSHSISLWVDVWTIYCCCMKSTFFFV